MRVKRLFAALLGCILALGLVLPFPVVGSKASAATEDGADFRSGLVKYILEDPLSDTPNTFEARIRVEKGANTVGNLFSNEVYRDFKQVSLAYYLNEFGNVCVMWNGGEKQVIFDEHDLRTDAWTHIAVVRDRRAGGFSLYLNGELAQTVTCGVGTDIKNFTLEHCIGGDFLSTSDLKAPFNGRISEVTIYSAPLTGGEIRRDYSNPDGITGGTRKNLMFHVRLHLGDVKLTDTSIYCNDAYLGTNDYFYGGEYFPTKDYSLAVLPDLQMLTNHYQTPIHTLPDFLLENADGMKIGALVTVGDLTDGITNGRDWDRQYNKVSKEFAKLDGTMPYIPVPGNHDYDNECKTDHSVTHFDGAFPMSKLSTWETCGGSFSPGSVVNAYYLMEFCGVKYCIFALDFGPSDEVLAWCCDVTERYPDRRIILTTHGFLDGNGDLLRGSATHCPSSYGWSSNSAITVNDADDIWEKWLKKYPNVFMTFSGHVFGDDIIVREFMGDHGNVVASFLLNAQGLIMNDGLELMLGMFTFDERNMQVSVNFSSTIRNELYNFQNQFVYDFSDNTDILSTVYYPDGVRTETVPADRAAYLKTLTEETAILAEPERIDPLAAILCTVAGAGVVAAIAIILKRRSKR